jgi:RHS repeat-associated protein
MSLHRRRRRVSRPLRFESLEERQLLHGGPGRHLQAEVLDLRIVAAGRGPRPADLRRLAEEHAGPLHVERATLRVEMATVSREWAALRAEHIGRATLRAERAALRAEWRGLRHEWAAAGHPHRASHLTWTSTTATTTTTAGPAPRPATSGPLGPVMPAIAGSITVQTGPDFTAVGEDPGQITITANPAPPVGVALNISVSVDAASTAALGGDCTVAGLGGVMLTSSLPSATITVTALSTAKALQQPWSRQMTLDLVGPTSSGTGTGTGTGGQPTYTLSQSSATVTIREPVNTIPAVGNFCPGCPPQVDLTPTPADASGGNPGPAAMSPSGNRYGSGGSMNIDPDLTSSGFGRMFGPTLQWTGVGGAANDSPYGIGWVDSSLPSLQAAEQGAGPNPQVVMLVGSATAGLWFDYNQVAGTYTARFFEAGNYTLTPDGATGDLVLADALGERTRFYGFGSGVPAALRGRFKGFTDADGNAIATSYGSTLLASVQRSSTAGGVTTTESFIYSYNAGLVSSVVLQRQVGAAAPTAIRKAVFTYYVYDPATKVDEPNGNPGDLKTEQIEDGNNNVLETSYFRYYKPGEGGGFTDGLKYYVTPESYDRLKAAVGDPQAASDAQVAQYADDYYRYDSQQRVTRVDAQGAGAAGPGTYTYTYSTSSIPDGYNSWKTKTTETLPDGGTDTVYTNYAGEVMLTDFHDGTDPANPSIQGQHWITLDRYDGSGRLARAVEPSAVTGSGGFYYSDSFADLMNFSGGTSAYLSDSTGVIYTYDYGASTTATATMAGDVLGYAKDSKVQVGEAGTPILLSSRQYIAHTAGGATVYPRATSTVYRNADGTGAETTADAYTWYSGTNAIQSDTATAPVVSAAQDGPATADTAVAYFDAYGRPTWTRDGDGYIDYTAYDNATGAVVTAIVDVDTTQTGEFTGLPAGWATPPGGGLNLVTRALVDGLGRPTKVTDPKGNVTYYAYLDTLHEVREYDGWNAGTNTPTGPTLVYREDRAGGYLETLTMSATPHLTAGVPDGSEAISGLQSLERDYTDKAGRVNEVDRYFNLAGVTYATTAHIGTLNTNYYATTYGYDRNGYPQRVRDALGTVTDTLYDGLGRPAAVYVGTDDSTTDGKPWTPANAAASSNMVQLEQDTYDGNGVGDSNLTQVTRFADASSDNRVTQYAYDGRDRLVATKSGVQATEDTATNRPITYYDLDNLGEATAISLFDGDTVALTNTKPAASLLRASEKFAYDDQGRLYRDQQYSVNQSTGAVSASALTTNLYYDRRGDLIAESDPGGLWTKDQYDGAGRLVSEARTDGGGGTSWAAAGSLAGDLVLTQTLTTYDADGNPILVADKQRFSNDTAAQTGPLGNPSTGPQARVYYTASYYDAADRPTADVDVGTNGGTAYTRPGTVPARSDTALVTSYAYDPAGNLQTITDPRGIVTRDAYDALERLTQEIDAYTNGTPTASSNQTTNTTYDGLGHVLTVQAVMPAGTPSQTTAYIYGVTTAGGSGVNSNGLLAKVEYPDPTTGNPSTAAADQESYKYNRLGDTATLTDPDGTTHSYAYDVLGRQTADAVTALGSGVDGSVRRRTVAYNALGLPSLFTAYNAAIAGTVVNQVQDVYNGLGQLTGEYQEHAGSVNTTTSPEVQYAYTEMAGGQNNSRPTQMTYPNGRKVDYVYNSGLDSSISRLSAIADDNSGSPGTTLESYAYLGLDTIVAYSHPEDGINLTYIQVTGDTHFINDGGDRYVGLDRFGRVSDQDWVKTSTETPTDRSQYGYDRDGDVLDSNNLVNSAQSELYRANSTASGDSNTAYDPLGRQTAFARGTLSSSGHNGTQLDTISTSSRSQSWSLDALGNWSSVTTNGTATARTFNAQDETASVSGGTAPAYNNNGDTTADSGLTFVYNAWDQPVAAKNGSTTVASYSYDALGRRVTETYGATVNHLYYSADWQVVEERQNGTAAANVTSQYVWGAGYVDQLVLRDSYSGGVKTQRLYAQWDANYDVTALVNTAGAVQERYLYDPYGSVTVTDAGWTPRAGNASSFGWRYLHQGGRLDNTTGWYAFRNRDLIPAQGRWAERDPLGFGGGDLNLYRFEGGSPADGSDPLGLADEWPLWEGFKAGNSEFWGNQIYGGLKGLVTGEAGQALGERAIGMAEARTGEPFSGSMGDWGRFGQGLGGDLLGSTGVVEGLSGYDLPSQQGIDGSERWRRGLAGGGSMVLNGVGVGGMMGKLPKRLPKRRSPGAPAECPPGEPGNPPPLRGGAPGEGEGAPAGPGDAPDPAAPSRPRPGAPAAPGDPYSPREVSKRQSETRRRLGVEPDPDVPIPDQGPGHNLGGHPSKEGTPHITGERNVGTEEHSRVAKGPRGPR